LPVCGVDVLIVVVKPWILTDEHEAALYVVAFQMRFQRTIVLMAQNDARVPTYYGPAPIVHALCTLPFEIIPWQRMLYRLPRPRSWQLPIPPEPAPEPSSANEAHRSIFRHSATTEDLSETQLYEPLAASAAERMARSTLR
jgi:hypothetical protein